MKRYLTGSCLFFNSIPDFKPHDLDYCELVEEQDEIVKKIEYSSGDIFRYKRLTPDEYVQYAITNSKPWALCQYLTPGFCKEVGFTIEHLKQLKVLRDNLPKSHEYEQIIYDSYISNGDYFLTESQLLKAFQIYQNYRKEYIFLNGLYHNKFKI